MNKNTRLIFIIIGVATILLGIYNYISDYDMYNAFLSIVIGGALIALVLYDKAQEEKKAEKEENEDQ